MDERVRQYTRKVTLRREEACSVLVHAHMHHACRKKVSDDESAKVLSPDSSRPCVSRACKCQMGQSQSIENLKTTIEDDFGGALTPLYGIARPTRSYLQT